MTFIPYIIALSLSAYSCINTMQPSSIEMQNLISKSTQNTTPIPQPKNCGPWCDDVLRNVLRLPLNLQHEIKQHLIRHFTDTILDYGKIDKKYVYIMLESNSRRVSPQLPLKSLIQKCEEGGMHLLPVKSLNDSSTPQNESTQHHSFHLSPNNIFILFSFIPPSPSEQQATLTTSYYANNPAHLFTFKSLLAAYVKASSGYQALEATHLKIWFDNLDPIVKNAIKDPSLISRITRYLFYA